MNPTELLTFGHGTLEQSRLIELLQDAHVELVVDVRTAPGSRRSPHVARAAMEQWLPQAGIAYRWEGALGGWRRPGPVSRHTALRNDSFRGYADYMESSTFWTALDGVLDDAAARRTAIMCSEAVYWRCHRRLIADAFVIGRGAAVMHIGHDGHLSPHRLTEGVRAEGGMPVYDADRSPRLPDM